MAEPAVRVLAVDDQEAVLADYARLLDPRPIAGLDRLDALELEMGGAASAAAAAPARYDMRYQRQGDAAAREVAAAATAGAPFGVAFVDVQMPPGIDGIETVARMWREQPDLEIVLCTAHADYSWQQILQRLSTHDQLVILRKPFDPIEVRQLAACLSEKWRRGRKLAQRVLALETRLAATARLQVELERAQKFDALGRLAAGIAHEINTPTQYVQSSLEFITDAFTRVASDAAAMRARLHALGVTDVGEPDAGELADEIPRALADADDGLRRVAAIVRSVREYAHPNKQHGEVDLNRLIQTAAELARNAYKHDAVLRLELGAVPLVPGHADELTGALLNLLVNAAQAIHGARRGQDGLGRITITSRATAHEVIVEVADSGPGIAAADRARIFDPFFTTKPVGQGTGQGLAIARATIVDGHRGTLTCESEPGHGATFRISLPIAAAAT